MAGARSANSWRRRLAALLVVAHLALAVAYSMVVPLFEAPDEPGHLDYILHLIRERALPVQSVERATYAHHPPLYYALAALPASLARLDVVDTMPQIKPDFRWPGLDGPALAMHHTSETFPYRGRALAVHLARLISVLCGALTVSLTIAIGWLLFPSTPAIGLLAGALVAFNPQFLFVSASVSNDALTAAASAGALWQLLRTLARPQRWQAWAALGAWLGAAALAKAAGLVMCGLAALAWAGWALRSRRCAQALRAAATCLLVFLILAGWWFVRNAVLYGDPLGGGVYRQAWADVLRARPPSLAEWLLLARSLFRSYWGVFGWMNVYAPRWCYAGAAALMIAGVLGWAAVVARAIRTRTWPFPRGQSALLAAGLVLQIAFVVFQNSTHNPSHAQGRYLFPAIAPAMLLLAAGVALPVPRRTAAVAGVVAACLLASAVLAAAALIAPAYRVVPLPKAALWTVRHRTDHVFGGMLALRGYSWEAVPTGEDARVTLRLYWQARAPADMDYSVFVHVLDAAGALLAQDDHAPGAAASYAPRMWQVEDLVADTWTVSLPAEAWQRGLIVRVGVYNWQSGTRLLLPSGADHVLLAVGRVGGP